jgi:hypothetical protein
MSATTDRVPATLHCQKRLKVRVFVQVVFLTGAMLASLAVLL